MPPQISKQSVNAAIPWIARPRSLTELLARLQALLERSPQIKPLSVLKYAVYIMFLLNIGSLPLLWHCESAAFCSPPLRQTCDSCGSTTFVGRVYWYIFKLRAQYWGVCFRLLFVSEKKRTREINEWLDDLSPVGANPMEVVSVFRRWASTYFRSSKFISTPAHAIHVFLALDDNDFFGLHLSNSCYAKACLLPVSCHELTGLQLGIRCSAHKGLRWLDPYLGPERRNGCPRRYVFNLRTSLRLIHLDPSSLPQDPTITSSVRSRR